MAEHLQEEEAAAEVEHHQQVAEEVVVVEGQHLRKAGAAGAEGEGQRLLELGEVVRVVVVVEQPELSSMAVQVEVEAQHYSLKVEVGAQHYFLKVVVVSLDWHALEVEGGPRV